jgi:hypothetical protein
VDFHLTVMGHRFIEGTMPRVAAALERIANALEEINARERAKTPNPPPPQESTP